MRRTAADIANELATIASELTAAEGDGKRIDDDPRQAIAYVSGARMKAERNDVTKSYVNDLKKVVTKLEDARAGITLQIGSKKL